MKYSSEYINRLSFRDYIKLMADELNSNGFTDCGLDYDSYEDDASMRRLFMMGPVNDPQAMAFLKQQGLIENGRCPSCGAPMSVYKYTWSDRLDSTKKYYLCYGCYKSHGFGDGRSMDGCPSGAPRNSTSGTGCILGILLMPFCLVKTVFMNVL